MCHYLNSRFPVAVTCTAVIFWVEKLHKHDDLSSGFINIPLFLPSLPEQDLSYCINHSPLPLSFYSHPDFSQVYSDRLSLCCSKTKPPLPTPDQRVSLHNGKKRERMGEWENKAKEGRGVWIELNNLKWNPNTLPELRLLRLVLYPILAAVE